MEQWRSSYSSGGAVRRPSRPESRRRSSNQSIGARGEAAAIEHLIAQGIEVIGQNWHCRWGEIDIIATETVDRRPTLIFCEVKTRTGRGYGSPLEAITVAKLQRLRRLAGHWLAAQGPRNSRTDWAEIRIDAVGVVLDLQGGVSDITHLRAVG